MPNIPDCKLKLSYADNGNVAKLGTITDYSLSGENNNGTLYGDCYVDADGMHFDGTGDYIAAGDTNTTAFIQNTLVFTVACWVYCDGLTQYFFCGSTVTAAEKGFRFGQVLDSGLKLQFRAMKGILATRVITVQSTSFPYADTSTYWKHIAVTGNGSSIAIYVDGESIPVTVVDAHSGYSTGNSTRPVSIGALTNFASNLLVGRMDGVHIVNRALSQPEISQLYSRGRR